MLFLPIHVPRTAPPSMHSRSRRKLRSMFDRTKNMGDMRRTQWYVNSLFGNWKDFPIITRIIINFCKLLHGNSIFSFITMRYLTIIIIILFHVMSLLHLSLSTRMYACKYEHNRQSPHFPLNPYNLSSDISHFKSFHLVLSSFLSPNLLLFINFVYDHPLLLRCFLPSIIEHSSSS